MSHAVELKGDRVLAAQFVDVCGGFAEIMIQIKRFTRILSMILLVRIVVVHFVIINFILRNKL